MRKNTAENLKTSGFVFQEEFLDPKTFSFFARKIQDLAGVHLPLTEKNQSLIKNRLSRLLRERGLSDFKDLAQLIESGAKDVREDFISALTTNKTHFFREEAHFDFLKQQLRTHFQQSHQLRIWCAASSTGQEPYTLAMVLAESLSEAELQRSRILATDIDLEVLEKAVQGIYQEHEMDGLPAHFRKKYFDQHPSKKEYRAKDPLARLIQFSRFNLVNDDYKFQGGFDYVFCRNVLIYFDPPTTKSVIYNLASSVRPGGFLVLGHSESGNVNDPLLQGLSQAIYQRRVGSVK